MSALLIMLSEISHLLLAFYRESQGQFLDPPTYRNWEDSIKYTFISVTVCNNFNIDK